MGGLAVAAGIALLRHARVANRLALLAFGLLTCSSINSAGWPLRNDLTLLIPMGVMLIAAVIAVPWLLRRSRES
jgi:hypothetical protein